MLVADAHMEYATKSLLGRSERLGVARIDSHVIRHPNQDPGCRTNAVNYLRQYIRGFRYSLVLFDRHGCGSSRSRQDIQNRVERDLRINGWEDRAKAIVIDPELEAWVWGYPEIAQVLRWKNNYSDLRNWLSEQGVWPAEALKPPDPKVALRRVMKRTGRIRSARMYEQIAGVANFSNCQDAAFHDLKSTLQSWFPGENP